MPKDYQYDDAKPIQYVKAKAMFGAPAPVEESCASRAKTFLHRAQRILPRRLAKRSASRRYFTWQLGHVTIT